MKFTLLDIVQQILSSMDSEEVNSIGDTAESRQVANIVRTAYYNILVRSNLPEHYKLFRLDASADPDSPVLMLKPSNVLKLDWIKYDVSEDTDDQIPNYQYITILPIQQFLDMTSKLDISEDFIESFTLNGQTFFFRNDRRPTFCTIFEDQYFIFDSYDSDEESTLQNSKTQCYGKVSPVFEMEDDFTPDLDDLQFALLLNEAKALAFLELKQIAHDQAVREARLQWQSMQHNKYLKADHPFNKFQNFGRSGPRL